MNGFPLIRRTMAAKPLTELRKTEPRSPKMYRHISITVDTEDTG